MYVSISTPVIFSLPEEFYVQKWTALLAWIWNEEDMRPVIMQSLLHSRSQKKEKNTFVVVTENQGGCLL